MSATPDAAHHEAPHVRTVHRAGHAAGHAGEQLAGIGHAAELEGGVEDRERPDPVAEQPAHLEADRPAGVVHREVEPVEAQAVDGGHGEPGEAGHGVVEVGGAVGEPEARAGRS